VFAPLIRGVDAFYVVTSFLILGWQELICLLAPAATASILTSLCLVDLVVHRVSAGATL
jgi:hypothetical protein